jgi:hypothetical protein
VGRLSYALEALDSLQKAPTAPEPTQEEVHVQAITESLVDLTERLEAAISAKKPIEPKDYTESLAKIAAALGQKAELGPLVEAINGITLSPQINVEAPKVEVEKAGPMLFTINRNDMGYITSVLATPYEGEEDDSSADYEME